MKRYCLYILFTCSVAYGAADGDSAPHLKNAAWLFLHTAQAASVQAYTRVGEHTIPGMTFLAKNKRISRFLAERRPCYSLHSIDFTPLQVDDYRPDQLARLRHQLDPAIKPSATHAEVSLIIWTKKAIQEASIDWSSAAYHITLSLAQTAFQLNIQGAGAPTKERIVALLHSLSCINTSNTTIGLAPESDIAMAHQLMQEGFDTECGIIKLQEEPRC